MTAGAEAAIREKRVTYAELFFDLVFVFAITRLSAVLHDDHSWAGVGRALILFIPIYWAWVGTSLHANFADIDRSIERLTVFAVGFFSLMMALGISGAFGDRGALVGASYMAIRVILAAAIFRGWRMSLNAFSIGLLVTGPLLVAGGMVDPPLRTLLWALAGLIDLSNPFFLRRRLAGIHFDSSHLPERFGLFVIIALGESIVAIGSPAATGALDPSKIRVVALAFVLACALWWVYFAYAADAMRHALSTSKAQTEIVREVLSYGHLLLIAAIIGLAVGLAEAVAHPDDSLPTDVAALLLGGCALYLATFAYTRWRMFRKLSSTRFAAALVLLGLLAIASEMPAIALVALTTVVLVGLNLEEYRRVRTRGGV
jgi:low temperature requirement protein LtrA